MTRALIVSEADTLRRGALRVARRRPILSLRGGSRLWPCCRRIRAGTLVAGHARELSRLSAANVHELLGLRRARGSGNALLLQSPRAAAV